MLISSPSVVLKFGGSVLHSPADFPSVMSEIQRYLDQDTKVVVVVSAFYGVTETLIARANTEKLSTDSVAYAELVASGEMRSAEELTQYLREHKLPAAVATPRALGFTAAGPRTSATPQSMQPQALQKALNTASVLVVPGFSAIDNQGDCVLLGRGGSDISAVCLAETLGLHAVCLLKDVDGLYDRDPNRFTEAQRLTHVDYATAKLLGGELIQPEAIDFAQSKNICIEIAAIGKPGRSLIGEAKLARATRPAERPVANLVADELIA